MTKTIAIVEDDRPVADLISRALQASGFRTENFYTGGAFLDALRVKAPNLCLVDLGLPDVDGMGLLSLIREESRVPVIIVSARRQSSDRIIGLELGADDYVVKPFDAQEIVARVRTVLRRVETEANGLAPTGSLARFAGWTFDSGSMVLNAPNGNLVKINLAESQLLQTLLEAPQRVLSRDYLRTRVGNEDDTGRSIDIRVSRLRKKLQSEGGEIALIRSVYGSGYLLACRVDWGNA